MNWKIRFLGMTFFMINNAEIQKNLRFSEFIS
jgi:hypothetical protein